MNPTPFSLGLHWACKLGRLDMAHVLVASDSDINSRAYNGMTPLHIASQSGHEEVIDFLLKESEYRGLYTAHSSSFFISHSCAVTF